MRVRAALVLTAGLLALVCAACVGPASELGTNDSPCYLALPAARAAVQGPAKFIGVRDVTIAVVDAGLHHTHQHPGELPDALRSIKVSVCAVGYAGSFTAAKVLRPWPSGVSSSRRVLVLVEQKNARVLATLLLGREPIRLSKIG